MLMTIIKAIQTITLGQILKYTIYFVIALFVSTIVSVFIEIFLESLKGIWIHFFNYKTTVAFERWCERKRKDTYHENSMLEKGDTIDISSLLSVTPKLVIKINIYTGAVRIEDLVIKPRLTEKILSPKKTYSKRKKLFLERTNVPKEYVYCQSIINSLNLRYFNWQKNNPELITLLEKEEIVDKELVQIFLENFKV